MTARQPRPVARSGQPRLLEQQNVGLNAPAGAALIPGWVILPLRLFLGLSFLLAGLDKLFDPAFLDPRSPMYLGNQLASAAPGTPLEGFLRNFAVPNATFFGVLVMGGEICIGVAILLGLFTRFSALMGLLVSLTFYLSITWNVQPFYFGADLPYAAGWLTLLLAGHGPLALDAALGRWLNGGQIVVKGGARSAATKEELLTRRAFLGLGATGLAGLVIAASGLGWGRLHSPASPTVARQPTESQPNRTGSATAGAGQAAPPAATVTEVPGDPSPATPPPPTAAPDNPGILIAGPGDLPLNRSGLFRLPSGDPAVLVHDANGYSAYSAVCTHEGCTVRPASGTTLRCPCHGATFDGSNGARVLRGPARRPLAPIAVAVASDGSVYLPN